MKVKFDTHVIQKEGHFKYFGFIIKRNMEIDKDATHYIDAGWMK